MKIKLQVTAEDFDDAVYAACVRELAHESPKMPGDEFLGKVSERAKKEREKLYKFFDPDRHRVAVVFDTETETCELAQRSIPIHEAADALAKAFRDRRVPYVSIEYGKVRGQIDVHVEKSEGWATKLDRWMLFDVKLVVVGPRPETTSVGLACQSLCEHLRTLTMGLFGVYQGGPNQLVVHVENESDFDSVPVAWRGYEVDARAHDKLRSTRGA